MPATANVTVTGTTGPDIDLAAKVFSNIKEFHVDFPKSVLTITDAQGKVTDFDYAITATLTFVIAAGVATITIS